MKKYLLFGGHAEKLGGWSDFSISFNSIGRCREYANHNFFHWYQIILRDKSIMVDSKYDIKW